MFRLLKNPAYYIQNDNAHTPRSLPCRVDGSLCLEEKKNKDQSGNRQAANVTVKPDLWNNYAIQSHQEWDKSRLQSATHLQMMFQYLIYTITIYRMYNSSNDYIAAWGIIILIYIWVGKKNWSDPFKGSSSPTGRHCAQVDIRFRVTESSLTSV